METLTAPPAVALPDPAPLADPDPVLLEAARLLREGWAQGDIRIRPHPLLRLLGARTRYCLVGALTAASGGYYGLSQFAGKLGFSNLQRAACWNDASGRTQEEVVERVERAAYGL